MDFAILPFPFCKIVKLFVFHPARSQILCCMRGTWLIVYVLSELSPGIPDKQQEKREDLQPSSQHVKD